MYPMYCVCFLSLDFAPRFESFEPKEDISVKEGQPFDIRYKTVGEPAPFVLCYKNEKLLVYPQDR